MARPVAPLLAVLLTLSTSAFAQSINNIHPAVNRPLIESALTATKHLPASATTPRPIAPSQVVASVPQSWPARHPMLLGALIGLAAGGVAGGLAEFCPGYSYSEGYAGNCRAEGVVWGAGVGAGVGALIGKLFSRD